MSLDVAGEVAVALRDGRAVVALESTIVAHGMPWPHNLETALAVEADVRAGGAIPATIAIVDGRLKAGLSRGEIERIARGGRDVAKASRRDMPIVVARGGTGATTVAATMIVAALAGIRVFATGGIGGVHRGAQASFDISADLAELARTPVAVVCAGAKAILDLRLTLEYLETQGVPMIGYRTDRLPAFWSRDSGLALDTRVDTPDEIARIMSAKWSLGLTGGVVIANPIPERFDLPRETIERAVESALREARERNIGGKALTPFLLERVNALTGGDSLASNVALVRNNASLAASVAVAYAALADSRA
ncbi:MAG TPA: pseudouridine-5'-phosphate glycosidase [Burkholderiales bacterium]|nr:pseudouridine-5'-phosphate glycosidase [Burkholderiales bacterium]